MSSHQYHCVFLDLSAYYGYNGVTVKEQAEVTSINKQKFLAELGKLLTFMYEEDRQRAIGMYSRMFEEACDEQALIQSLISPTRQAVVVARAYNSNLGRLSLTSESKAAPEDRDENGTPDYVQAIEAVREKAWAAQGMSVEAESKEEPVEEEIPVEDNSPEEISAEAETEENPEPETESAAESDELSGEENGETEEAAEEPASEEETEPEKTEELSEEAEQEEPSEPESESPVEADASTEETETRDEGAEEASSEPKEEEEIPAAAASAEEDRSEKPEGIEFFTLPEAGKETPESETLLDENGFNVDSDALRKPRRKPKVFALILYILLAIPLTICVIAVLLVPAILFLALSIATIIGGVVLVSTAFKGFAVFADIMVVLGVSLVLFALGLLFLWTAIWFIGGAIVGVVHGVAVLCEKWCYKEVLEA